MPLYYPRLYTLGILGHQNTLRRNCLHSVASVLKLFSLWWNFLTSGKNKLFYNEFSWETSICFLCSGRSSFLLCLTTLHLLTVVRSLPLWNSSLVHLKVSTKLSVLMSFVVILQDSVREIYLHRLICHRLILISGKHHWKLSTFDIINQVPKLPLPPWPYSVPFYPLIRPTYFWIKDYLFWPVFMLQFFFMSMSMSMIRTFYVT